MPVMTPIGGTLTGILGGLVSDLRIRLRDNPTDTSLRKWADNELILFLDEGQYELCRRAKVIEDRTTAAVCTITLATGYSSYTLHSKIVDVNEDAVFSYDGSLMKKRTLKWLDENRPTWRDETGRPTDFVITSDNKILVTPTPTVTYNTKTISLVVKRLPLLDLSVSNTTPEVPVGYYEEMRIWALHLAYLKQDAETKNDSKAIYYEKQFALRVGDIIPANIERIERTEPDNLQIGIYRG